MHTDVCDNAWHIGDHNLWGKGKEKEEKGRGSELARGRKSIRPPRSLPRTLLILQDPRHSATHALTSPRVTQVTLVSFVYSSQVPRQTSDHWPAVVTDSPAAATDSPAAPASQQVTVGQAQPQQRSSSDSSNHAVNRVRCQVLSAPSQG